MLDLSKYQSIGGALKDAVEVFANETCLIEADRERENHRLTYREFRDRAMPIAKALQDAGFAAGDRAAIIMTNQSKWLIAAYAIFYSGGVLVPLDYKLTADEQWQLLKHSSARVLITEYPIWRQLSVAKGRARCHRTSNGHRDRSPDRYGFAWRRALGSIQRPGGRAGISAAHAQRCRHDCVFVGNRRPAERLRDDA